MNILVTGGAGFIGSHLVDSLVNFGHKVTVLDNLSSGNESWVNSRAEFIYGDLSEKKIVTNLTKNCDVIFHLAAMSRSGPSINQPELCFTSNTLGTHNLLMASLLNGVKKIIYSASSTCYGNQPIPHSIESKLEFLNFYSLSKFYAEQELILASKNSDLSVISLRYFNVYGNRQPLDGNYALVTGIFLRAKSLNRPVEIHGDGNQTRDFVHVSDVVLANLAALNSDIKTGIYNVGFGKGYSVLEIAKILDLTYSFGPKRLGDAQHTLADIQKTSLDLNWEPKTQFRDGLLELL